LPAGVILCFHPIFSSNYLSSDQVLLAAFEKLFISFGFFLAEAHKLHKGKVAKHALEKEGFMVKAKV